MILVLGGTTEGRQVAAELAARGFRVMVSTATPYGGELLSGCGVRIITGPLNLEGLLEIIRGHKVRLLVDATHPFACRISDLACRACAVTGIPYLRLQRAESALPSSHLVYRVRDYEEASRKATELGRTIFLATGSKSLPVFLDAARQRGCRIIVRVLPEPEVLQRCRQLGLKPADIVAMQGPFGRELNRALFRHYRVDVVVTKNSGDAGGTASKVEAALELNIPVVVIDQPRPAPGETVHSLADLIDRIIQIERSVEG